MVQFENPRVLATVQRDQIGAIDVRIGSERHVLRGMGRGFLIGAGSGLVMGLASGGDDWFSAEEMAGLLGAWFGLVGTVVGLIVGLATQSDVWSPGAPIAPVDVALVPLVGPAGPALQVGISFKFK